jgi:MFS family permease
VEHPCQRCGLPVEDDAPFCNSCGAPQVRFSGTAIAPPAKIAVPSTPGLVQPDAAPITPVPNDAQLERASAIRAVVAAGAIAALLSLLPLGFLLGSPLGGFLSVLLYRRRTWAGDPSPRAGFRLGARSGIFGFAIFVVLAGTQVVLLHGENEVRKAMVEAVRHQQARNPDPQARQMLDYFLTPHGLLVMMMVGLIFMGLMFVLLSGVGGAISAALLRRKEPPR